MNLQQKDRGLNHPEIQRIGWRVFRDHRRLRHRTFAEREPVRQKPAAFEPFAALFNDVIPASIKVVGAILDSRLGAISMR